MYFLCLDPSFRHFGYSVITGNGTVVDIGTIVTCKAEIVLGEVENIKLILKSLFDVCRKHKISAILSELAGGSQSAAGAKGLAIAMTITTCLSTGLDIPIEWATPTEGKQALTGNPRASKEDMMIYACKLQNWKIEEKEIFAKKTKKLQRVDKIYFPLDQRMGKGKFEHIADSIGIYEALKNSDTVKGLQP